MCSSFVFFSPSFCVNGMCDQPLIESCIPCFVHSYNSAVPVPPAGWPLPPRPQPWFPQPPAVSIPPPAPVGYAQQPLFPVQNVRPPLPSSTAPAQVAPPGLPSSAPPIPVSQPLFPVVNNNLPQSSPFSAPLPSPNISSSSPAEVKGSVDVHSGANSSLTTSFHTSIPGLITCPLLIDIKIGFPEWYSPPMICG